MTETPSNEQPADDWFLRTYWGIAVLVAVFPVFYLAWLFSTASQAELTEAVATNYCVEQAVSSEAKASELSRARLNQIANRCAKPAAKAASLKH